MQGLNAGIKMQGIEIVRGYKSDVNEVEIICKGIEGKVAGNRGGVLWEEK